MPEIETTRLRLRHCTLEDLDTLSVIRSDPNVMQYIGKGKPQSRKQVKEVILDISSHWQEHGFGRWGIVHKEDRRLIGLCGLSYLENRPDVEVGYTLAKAYWGQGFASEVAAASLRYGFEEVKLDRIVALAYPENTASRRVMDKLGMHFVKTTRFFGGDLVYYEISSNEYRTNDSLYLLRN
jgi:RimJ/RimL family protein N-acetyltransferase